ncbi:hypothetical protein D3C77_537320 [compost metagenome]
MPWARKCSTPSACSACTAEWCSRALPAPGRKVKRGLQPATGRLRPQRGQRPCWAHCRWPSARAVASGSRRMPLPVPKWGAHSAGRLSGSRRISRAREKPCSGKPMPAATGRNLPGLAWRGMLQRVRGFLGSLVSRFPRTNWQLTAKVRWYLALGRGVVLVRWWISSRSASWCGCSVMHWRRWIIGI